MICQSHLFLETIQAQGCLENLAEDLRMKCNSDDVENMSECHKCNDNLCNNMAASSFECVQCDSKTVGTAETDQKEIVCNTVEHPS